MMFQAKMVIALTLTFCAAMMVSSPERSHDVKVQIAAAVVFLVMTVGKFDDWGG